MHLGEFPATKKKYEMHLGEFLCDDGPVALELVLPSYTNTHTHTRGA